MPEGLATRSALIGVGLIIGFVIGWAASPSARKAGETSRVAENSGPASGRFASDSADASAASKIILGDIAKVPFQELYTVLSARSPAELAQIAQQLNDMPDNVETGRKIAAFFKAWAHFDARSAFSSAVTLKTIEARARALGSVVQAADATAMPFVARAINELGDESLPPDRKRGIVGNAATKWSEIDPPAAAKFLQSVTAGAGKFFGDTSIIAENWGAIDPQAALAWAQEQDRGHSHINFATNGAIGGWWSKDPRAAEAYVAAQAGGPNKQTAANLASRIANTDPERAAEWVKQLPDTEARRMANAAIAMQFSWKDPKGATEWALTLPADDRGYALSAAIENWSRADAQATADWVSGLPEPERDTAVVAYSGTAAYRDPAAALAWASTINDPGKRQKSTERIFSDWIHRSKDEATAWVQNSQLPEDQKAKLLAAAPAD